ncbi:MAG: formyltetrahydrofolate deformylase [Candidatus Dadabacteria bacterium]|nr:formyltetrahydrofolate deformylase [Candidatus Dadabacteria bacterium]NIS07212.1 formyltetrahydrofolate deformylase [Candidatus Dadabacteria bacterium]NIV40919.1 formyltetrahydrofolate deformylase [Candidatus Dadabacteria bacterium]NIX14351.1 formyltetrahydrofolate deformylase [Candidatus Dadabacteria bacterium]NIY20869.1 formyltetrahydrofolate deformylase [Candidatus Dadabacteria bacterium]
MNNNIKATLLFSCPDRPGLVSKISQFIFEIGGNILDLVEHVEIDEKFFSIRIAWEMDGGSISQSDLNNKFKTIADEFNADWKINFKDKKKRAAIFVSKYDHCLQEILWRHKLSEYDIDIPLIISNHPDLSSLAASYSISFHVFEITKENKSAQENKELQLLRENDIHTIVMARYMQILSPVIIDEFPNQIINIHHSFLPAFIGGNPYKQAFERGVKIIGATSHYATLDLDEGPIIEQDIIRISHKDSIEDLKRKGRDLERLVLARALHYHFEDRILVRGKKTIIFE